MNTLFPATETKTGLTPRPYQEEAIDTLYEHICTKETNPCVVIPTGGGKSIMMAWTIQRWKAEYRPFRVCILAHRKELVQQNAEEMRGLWPGGDIGIFSAGLRQKDWDCSVLFASIDSIYNKAGEFPPWDCLIIDEAHRIPARGEGKYRQYIEGCKRWNKRLRIVGFTATPFRMGCGPICHKDHILHEVCYEANVGDLIHQGFLCKLRSKIGAEQTDLSNVKRNSGGDYVVKSLAEAVDTEDVVQAAVADAMQHINNEGRKSVMWFCVDVQHCKDVSTELRKYGIDAPYVTGKTRNQERDRVCDLFKRGVYRHICNVNVYTEGFNAKQVDCIVLLRPTLSVGLYVQMVGRGLRLHPDKADCLVLDYAHCIDSHGPIDAISAGEVRLETCQECGDVFSRAIKTCPNCGWTIPKEEVEKREAEEAAERRMHDRQTSQRNILSSEPEELKVDAVTVHRHRKPDKPDSIRVQYRCGLATFREWICLDHGGFAESKAREWWYRRFGREKQREITVNGALQDLFLGEKIAAITDSITVKKSGRHFEIIDYKIKNYKERIDANTM